jgi:hypothetical protein
MSSTAATMQVSTVAPHVPSVPRPEVKQPGAALQRPAAAEADASFHRRHDLSHDSASPERQQSNWAFATRSTDSQPEKKGSPQSSLGREREDLETRLWTASSAGSRNYFEPPASFARMTRKRAAEQAGLDEEQSLAEQDNTQDTEQQISPSSHICLCQPDPKIPRPRNGE